MPDEIEATTPGEAVTAGVVLGKRVGPYAGCLDREFVRRYAAATADPSPLAQQGQVVPTLAIVTQIWDAQNESRDELVPEAVQHAALSGVHGEHDVMVHRPIEPGEPLRTFVEGHGARPAGRNTVVTLRYVTVDRDDEVVAEQWWSTVYLGTTCQPAGEPAPDHAFPEGARPRLLGTDEIEVDAEMARRYAEVSGDWSPHHFDGEAARRSGADRPFLHGLCTMALCARGIARRIAEGDSSAMRRLAVRFATPMPIGERLSLRVHDAGPLGFAFEATCGDAIVISHGRAELR